MSHRAPGEPSAYASAPAYDDGRLDAPSAVRNRDAVTAALTALAPQETTGTALEIASGTGQHVIHFAATMPDLIWQPTDLDADRRVSITAWTKATPSPNLLPPIALDACAPGWAEQHAAFDLIFFANLLHLVPTQAAQTCLDEVAKALKPGGRAVVYGPFLRDGKATSQGDAEFDARIKIENPGAGYKDVAWVLDQWTKAGLTPATPQDMPANNLLLSATRPA